MKICFDPQQLIGSPDLLQIKPLFDGESQGSIFSCLTRSNAKPF
jgi:hypothetical protein